MTTTTIPRKGGAGWNKGKGKVPGSGRKPGTKNKATIIREQLLEQAAAKMRIDASQPMEFFANILKDKSLPYEERKFAAVQLMSFTHPKIASVDAGSNSSSHEDRLERLQKMRARVVEHQGGRGETEG